MLSYTRSEPNSTQITQELFILSLQNEIHFDCVSVATSTSSTSNHLTRHVPSWTLQKSHRASVKWYVYKCTVSKDQSVFETECVIGAKQKWQREQSSVILPRDEVQFFFFFLKSQLIPLHQTHNGSILGFKYSVNFYLFYLFIYT